MPTLTPRELALVRWARTPAARRSLLARRLARHRHRVLSAGRQRAIGRKAGLASAAARAERKAAREAARLAELQQTAESTETETIITQIETER